MTLVRKQQIKAPNWDFKDPFWNAAGKVKVAGVLNNIKTKSAPGSASGSLKVNADSTKTRKRNAGRPVLSLIDEGKRLVTRANYAWEIIRGGVGRGVQSIKILATTQEVADIIEFVDELGYVGWRDSSALTIKAFRSLLKKEVLRLHAEAARKSQRSRR